jgi:type I restriction enzyme S subunit
MDFEAPYINAGWMSHPDSESLPTMFAHPHDVVTYGVVEHDLVVAEGGDIGRTAFIPATAAGTIIQNSLHRVRPRNGSDLRFLRYALDALYGSGWLDVLCNRATFGHLTQEKLKALRVPLRNLDEQVAIGDYLDMETARIDTVIEKKRRISRLLSERRDALIRHVTRLGLRDHQLKPSGIPWIGDVPEGWLVLPLRRVGDLVAGTAFPDSEQGRVGEPIPYFKVADFSAPANAEYLTVAENTVTGGVAAALGSPIYPKDSVVFPKIGAALLSNRRRMLQGPSCTDQNIMGLVVRRGCPRYYYYLLQSVDFGRLRMPGPVPLLNEADAASILVPVPPDDEQSTIVAYLDETLPTVARSFEVIDRQVQLLEERRRTIITDAVSGEVSSVGVSS